MWLYCLIFALGFWACKVLSQNRQDEQNEERVSEPVSGVPSNSLKTDPCVQDEEDRPSEKSTKARDVDNGDVEEVKPSEQSETNQTSADPNPWKAGEYHEHRSWDEYSVDQGSDGGWEAPVDTQIAQTAWPSANSTRGDGWGNGSRRSSDGQSRYAENTTRHGQKSSRTPSPVKKEQNSPGFSAKRLNGPRAGYGQRPEGELCPICVRPFSNLQHHIRDMHSRGPPAERGTGGQTVTCEVCAADLSNRGELRKHKSDLHSWSLHCIPCAHSFPDALQALAHYQMDHAAADATFETIEEILGLPKILFAPRDRPVELDQWSGSPDKPSQDASGGQSGTSRPQDTPGEQEESATAPLDTTSMCESCGTIFPDAASVVRHALYPCTKVQFEPRRVEYDQNPMPSDEAVPALATPGSSSSEDADFEPLTPSEDHGRSPAAKYWQEQAAIVESRWQSLPVPDHELKPCDAYPTVGHRGETAFKANGRSRWSPPMVDDGVQHIDERLPSFDVPDKGKDFSFFPDDVVSLEATAVIAGEGDDPSPRPALESASGTPTRFSVPQMEEPNPLSPKPAPIKAKLSAWSTPYVAPAVSVRQTPQARPMGPRSSDAQHAYPGQQSVYRSFDGHASAPSAMSHQSHTVHEGSARFGGFHRLPNQRIDHQRNHQPVHQPVIPTLMDIARRPKGARDDHTSRRNKGQNYVKPKPALQPVFDGGWSEISSTPSLRSQGGKAQVSQDWGVSAEPGWNDEPVEDPYGGW